MRQQYEEFKSRLSDTRSVHKTSESKIQHNLSQQIVTLQQQLSASNDAGYKMKTEMTAALEQRSII